MRYSENTNFNRNSVHYVQRTLLNKNVLFSIRRSLSNNLLRRRRLLSLEPRNNSCIVVSIVVVEFSGISVADKVSGFTVSVSAVVHVRPRVSVVGVSAADVDVGRHRVDARLKKWGVKLILLLLHVKSIYKLFVDLLVNPHWGPGPYFLAAEYWLLV